MRTQKEIVDRIEEVKKHDLFGFEGTDLIAALDFEHAKPFLKEGFKKKDWKPDLLTDEAVIKLMVEYMDFAIEKATDHRGLSAGRSISHYRAWLWLIGDDKLIKFAECADNYRNYGAPILKKIAKKYKAPVPKGHAGKIFNAMAKGEVCPDCISGDMSGCGE
jgi:hypothetical protein